MFLVSVLAMGTNQAMDKGSYQGQPLTQVEFTKLVPITYSLVTTQFTALEPTSYPVIQPGVAQVHIIETLVHPMEQPLLRTY